MNQLLLPIIFFAAHELTRTSRAEEFTSPIGLFIGFKATPKPSVSAFQPLLADPTRNFSLGFLRINQNQLILCVLHVSSSVTLWSAYSTRFAKWADTTQLLFNGSLVLSDPRTGVFWSTRTDGDLVHLSDTSNLQILKLDGRAILWQSFHFPSDTLVENQTFNSTMALVSSNLVYSMRLGPDFIGLYANFKNMDTGPGQIYSRHRALEAKADIIPGRGPIYAVLKSGGYLGMFQNGAVPVDVQPFNSFQQNVSGVRRVTLEPDGNLKGYYWTGSSWILDYDAISAACELPSSCGSYGLCTPNSGCSCLDNRAAHITGDCPPQVSQISGDLCGGRDNRYKVVRRNGVELPYKELMGYKIMKSYNQCEIECQRNCTCWGVVYSNSSGFCYILDYPIQTLVAVEDETRMGYFKVRKCASKRMVDPLRFGIAFGAILVFSGVSGLGLYVLGNRRVKGNYVGEDGFVYKDLGAASSRSIEMCEH